tara:strand:+ start:1941 stop:2915 length:975 start_codon:yes stop_codon:yes gene_type:complete
MTFKVRQSNKNTVSIITACKNRVKALKVSLTSWLTFDEVKEVIIVDWNSDEPINYLTKLDSRVKVIRVDDKEYFNQPQPLNLASSIATGKYIVKVDADHIFNPYKEGLKTYCPTDKEFFCGQLQTDNPIEQWCNEDGDSFINVNQDKDDYGQYLLTYNSFYRYLAGILYVSKENFDAVGGYNEKLGDCYAYEDIEICQRLEVYGLKKNMYHVDNYEFVHLPHGDDKRIENFKGFEGQELYEHNCYERNKPFHNGDSLKWQIEYALSEQHNQVNKGIIGEVLDHRVYNKTKWKINNIDDQNYYATDITENEEDILEFIKNYIFEE